MKAPIARERERRLGLVGGSLMILLPALTSLVSVSTSGTGMSCRMPCQTTSSPTSFLLPIAVWIISGVITIVLALMLKEARAGRRFGIGLSLLVTSLVYLSGVALFVGYEIYSVPSIDPVLVSLWAGVLCLGPLVVLIDGILIVTRPPTPEPSIPIAS
ncbi:hypothetical protein E6H12_00520 [Candidatus Bathyarchaeota archaeon]|nr:MAG: hypothetical protein E6H12_00520 [Candidatus Bathyarchaeota archaeon]